MTFFRTPWLPLVASLALSVSACGGPAVLAAPADAQALQARASRAVGGNAVKLLIDGPQIFDEIEATIRGAKRTVQLHIFQLGGETGTRIVQALAERQAAGVQVQVLLDPNHGGAGSVKQQFLQCVAALDKAGIVWRDFDLSKMPKGPNWLSRLGLLDHSKLVVVDGEAAILGGMNFYDDGLPNHDYMVKVEGPAATQLGEMTNADWLSAGGPAEGLVPLTAAAPRGDANVALGETSPRRRSIRGLLGERFAAARSKIWTEVLFLDDDKTIDALVKARKRGVDVRVILDPIKWGNHVQELEKMPFNGIPNWSAVQKLLAADVPVRWYVTNVPKRNLHAKISMVDDRFVTTGSANYTYRSLDRSRETVIEIESAELAQAFGTQFLADEAVSEQVPALSAFQRTLAGLFDRVKRGIYDESRDLPAPGGTDTP